MRTLLTLPLAAALLCGCTNTKPIVVSVPSDPHILQGTFTGTAGIAMPGASSQTFPVVLTATATYVSPTVYNITGTLTFQNATYALQGEGEGRAGATFRPQYSPIPEPSLFWKADLLLNEEKVGEANGISFPRSTTEQQGNLRVGGADYSLILNPR